ncbi:hypothetical protein N7474_006223 [Penicillium riverlandense]|uniref:uncharacterized protein n=1 Tax=Penicillium riverlandense TaxID=1903569 RepID=UPI002546B229|nr:uncharacterized protein N7474_006223 [Penicillium riverlandense]KAJ5820632.1 hypothetical protein N7474_006223 [Penicillium riverlandense]
MVEPENLMEEDADTGLWPTQSQQEQQLPPHEAGHLFRQLGRNPPPRRQQKLLELRINPPQPPAPTPTEDTQAPSHGFDLGIEIPSFLAFGSSPSSPPHLFLPPAPPTKQAAPESESEDPIGLVDDDQFFEASDGSHSMHGDHNDDSNNKNDLYNE